MSELFTDPWRGLTESFSDLVNESDPSPLVDGFLYEDDTCFITGQAGAGKSFVAVSLAASIATGTPWFGHEVQQGRVLYVTPDVSPRNVMRRLQAWEIENDKTIDFDDHLRFMRRFSFKDKADREVFERLTDYAGLSVIFIDTLTSSTSGINLSNKHEVDPIQEFVNTLKAKALGRLAVVIISHSTKSDDQGISGSMALLGMAETIYSVTKGAGNTVKTVKNRNGGEGQKWHFAIGEVSVPGSDRPIGVLQSKEPIAPVKAINRNAITAALGVVVPGEWIATAEVLKSCMSSGMPKSTFYDTKRELIDAGIVLERSRGRFTDLTLANESESESGLFSPSALVESGHDPESESVGSPSLRRETRTHYRGPDFTEPQETNKEGGFL